MQRKKLLIVDDDPDILLTVKLVLKKQFTSIHTESQPHTLTDLLTRERYDLILLDMNFTTGFTSGKEGLRWLKKIRKLSPQTPVVLMTAYGDIDLAVKAMKEGAQDFVIKPWENEELIEKVKLVSSEDKARRSPARASGIRPIFSSDEIIGKSPALEAVFQAVDKVAQTEANVLLLGENGTGKELIARRIHQLSQRADQPFIHVDVGAIPESLFESEMFGHVKGAFTDAHQDRTGRLVAAQGGTLLLDEIGNLPLAMQAKLLTVLQQRKVQPVGSNQEIQLDFRLICATNRSLLQMVETRKFRQDLLYRINTLTLQLPALRERLGDIRLLGQHFLQLYSHQYGKPPLRLGENDWLRLEQYAWPGNIRELRHAIERAVIMENSESLLPYPSAPDPSSPEKQEKDWIVQALARNGGNVSQAALEMGWARTTLYKKMEKYGLGNT